MPNRGLRLLVPVALAALLAAACSATAGSGGGGPGAAAGPAGSGPAAAAEARPTPGAAREGITVVGTGRITGRPDTLRATVGVDVERPTVQEALDAANRATEETLEALRSAGVAEEDIATTEFSVRPRHREGPDDRPEIRGYTVTNLVEVTIRDLSVAGETLDAAVEAAGDAARVRGLRFSLEDNQELLSQAREAAFAEARAKAEQYAQLSGGSLGSLVSLTETAGDQPPPVPFAGDVARGEAAAPAARPPIEPGTQEVIVRVTATWSLR